MAESPPSDSAAARVIIRELSKDDVLCGRGPGLSHFQGNLRFRELIEERKCRYAAAQKRKDKGEIAKEVYDLVHGAGGRFLKRENDDTDDWHCVDYAVAIEKCKQALREHDTKSAKRSKRPNEARETSSALSSLHSSSNGSTCAMGGALEAPLSKEASTAESLGAPFQTTTAGRSPFDTFQSTASSASEAMHTLIDKDCNIHRSPKSCDDVTSNAAAVPLSGAPAFSLRAPTTNAQLPETHHTATSSAPPPIIDPKLLLFQNSSFTVHQQSMIAQSILRSQLENFLRDRNNIGETPLVPEVINNNECRKQILQALIESANVAAAASHQQFVASNDMYSLIKNYALLQSCAQNGAMQQADYATPPEVVQSSSIMQTDGKEDRKHAAVTSMAGVPEKVERRSSDTSIDEELSAFLLSSLAISDRPVVTEEQEKLEMNMMSDAEKADLLSDVFGRMLDDPPESKRQRVDLDKGFIAFLVNQMRIEIENIPESKKQALIQAFASEKCSADEFSDARLELFLRCENMNVKMAAQRFVNYWDSRLDVFGYEKFLLPMKLSGALREDLIAVQTGLYIILPRPDVSGRPILFMEPRCHTRERYTSESMLRAIWYIVEVTAEMNDDISGSVVNIVWFKNATLLDYDVKVIDRWAYLMSSCWPVKLISNHLCCAPTTILQVAKPIVHSNVSKEFRARTLVHAVPEEEILQVLWTYGIQSEMLPTQMGGALALDLEDWISGRRAAELDERL